MVACFQMVLKPSRELLNAVKTKRFQYISPLIKTPLLFKEFEWLRSDTGGCIALAVWASHISSVNSSPN